MFDVFDENEYSFGDKNEYEKSELKIITVGLNPSLVEFPVENPELRFKFRQNGNVKNYINSLNEYFYDRNNPYMRWFDSYENLINGLDASYRNKMTYRALHTDLGSVLATNPTWSELNKDIKRNLSDHGIQIWHDLMLCLDPDIIIVSVAKEWLTRIKFRRCSDDLIIEKFDKTKDNKPRKKLIEIIGSWIELNNKKTLLVYAPAAQKPIDKISHDHKKIAGNKILKFWKDKI